MYGLGLQIYKKGRACAVVDKCRNYALCQEGEPADGFVDFRQDGTWVPVRFNAVPAWLKEQIKESEEFESGKGGVN